MYLLDTNHCSGILGGDQGVEAKLSADDDLELSICVALKGELVFMAQNSEHKNENMAAIKALCSRFTVYDIDEEISEIYGEVKASLVAKFGPRDKSKRRKFKMHKELGISDNDLWIASVAIKNNLVLLTNDEKDFSRITAVSKLRKENWLTKIH